MSERELFEAALELPASERAAFLNDACGGDVALRLRLVALLSKHDEAGSFLEKPVITECPAEPATTDMETVPETKGQLLAGRYRLLEQIGEGGMGAVWSAQQTEPVKRLVAVKLIKPGMDTKSVLARFEAERQALALMDHPNIAKVHDAGTTPDGRPFFVMEVVKGVSITKYCDEHRLTPRQRLELFMPVCLAIQHAHQKGIIHRDIKPSNVLVAIYDDPLTLPSPRGGEGRVRGVPKVIDFGVAKATGRQLTDQTLDTGFGTVVGTVEYMSPEQAGSDPLDVDTRSDIYSLGVLLYELLTGSPPFSRKELEKAGMLEMLRVIREQEPSKPSTKLSTADGLPTLAANRGTEPARLTRLLRGELDWIVMKALEKDRNRRYATANGFAMDVQRYLADEPVQACPPSWRYRLGKFVRRNKRLLAMAAVLAIAVLGITGTIGWAIREREAQNEEQARETARRLSLTEQRIRDVLTQAREHQAGLRDQLQEKGGIFKLLNNPADWRRAIDQTRAALGRAKDLQAGAEGLPDQLATEIDQLERLVARDEADLTLALRLEKIREDRSAIADGFFDQERATQEYSKVFKEVGLNLKDGAAEKIALAMRRSPLVAQLVSALDDWAFYASLNNQGDWQARLLQINRLTDPDPWRDRVRNPEVWRDGAALDKLAQEALTHDASSASLSPQMFELVGVLLNRNKRSPEPWFKQGLQRFPKDYWLHLNFGNHLFDDRPAEAAGAYRAALAVRPQSSAAWDNLGLALSAQKDLSAAVAAFNKALEIDPKFARVWANLGLTFYHQKDLPAAVVAIRKAVEFDREDAKAWNNLGMALRAQKDLPGAIAAFNKAIQINPKAAKAWNQLANALHDQNDLPAAIKAYKKAIKLNPTSAEIRNNMGIAFRDQKDLPSAISAYMEALELDPKYELARNNLAEAWNSLGVARRAQGDLPGAFAAHKKAVEFDPNFGLAWNNLGAVLHDQKNFAAAVDAFKKALKLDPKNALALGNLGNGLRDVGDLPGAIAAYQESLVLRAKDADTWHNLADARLRQNDVSAGISAFKKALEFAPKNAKTWYSLGNALKRDNDTAAAIAAYKTAVELNPNYAQAWNNLAATYIDFKDLPAASAAYDRALEANPKLPEALIGRKTCNRLLHLDQRLPLVLGGAKTIVAEQLALADFCVRFHRRYKDAIQLYTDVLAKEPKVAADLSKGIRFEAARLAVFTAGHGTVADNLDDKERTRLRQQALAWLQTEFSSYGQRLKNDAPSDTILIHERLTRCQKDRVLASVRDAKETAKLSANERKAWQELWADAEVLLKEVRKSFTATSMNGTLTATERECVHELKMTAGKCYVIDLTSVQFDAYLRLEDAQKKVLAENDDMEDGKILDSRVEFTPQKDGVYRIIATSFQQRGAGVYTLIIREFAGK